MVILAAPRRGETRPPGSAANRGRPSAPASRCSTIGTDDASTRCAGPTGSPKIVSCRRSSRAPKPTNRPKAGRRASHGWRAKVVVRIRNSLANTPNGGRPAMANTASAKATAKPGMGDTQSPDLGEALRALGLGDVAHGEEDARFGQAVHRHVQQAGEVGERPAHAEGEHRSCPCARSRSRRRSV